MASFWVFAHEPQQSMVIKHMITATKYDWTAINGHSLVRTINPRPMGVDPKRFYRYGVDKWYKNSNEMFVLDKRESYQ